jgi:hypothetical protein
MEKLRISFEKCDKAFAERVLGLKRNYEFDSISDWLHKDTSISEVEIEGLKKARKTALARIDDWNEETLKMHFISAVLNLVDFNTNQYSAFADEKIEAELDNVILTGKADWFVASGMYKPEVPYFFFHEYKRRNRPKSDPEGQLLAEMVAARHLNNMYDEKMYGVVVVAKDWNFVVLDRDQYSISTAYNSMDMDSLIRLFKALRVAKYEFIEPFFAKIR